MTALLVPIALDVLLVRDEGTAFAPTRAKVLTPDAVGHSARRRRLVPDPFGPDETRTPGAYLHWALPDGLSHSAHQEDDSPVFPAMPERWLVLRMTGDAAAGPRTLTAWLIPDVNTPDGQAPTVVADALHAPPAPVGAPPQAGTALTVMGTGDVAWAAYFDNTRDRLGLYDPLTGVSGAVSYLVCGWYIHPGSEPLAAVNATSIQEFLHERRWSLPPEQDPKADVPTATVCHGAALGLGWPKPGWPGDGGVLGQEADGVPAAAGIGVAIAETMAEASAVLGSQPGDPPQLTRLMEAAVAGALGTLAHPDGPAQLDTALHLSRFQALATDTGDETIWQPAVPGPTGADGTPAPPAAGAPAPAGLAATVAESRRRAGLGSGVVVQPPQGENLGPADLGDMVDAGRSKPRDRKSVV